MPELPNPIRRLDAVFSASLIAHEAIFEMRRELVGIGRAGRAAAELLEESARLTLIDLPEITVRARRLTARWDEQSLLDPAAAQATLQELAT